MFANAVVSFIYLMIEGSMGAVKIKFHQSFIEFFYVSHLPINEHISDN